MNEPIQKTIPVEVSEDSCNSCLDFIASDAMLDRYDEISGWKLENYQRNPVFQNSQQYGDILFTLGNPLCRPTSNKRQSSRQPPGS